MHSVLRRLDLNLLPAFDAIFRHRSVRLAADELAMSTSALSHALSRLRAALNDPLFYREGYRMCPSVYACQLAPAIAAALGALNQQLMPQPTFDPITSDACFQIGMSDYTVACIFPALMHQLQHQAPHLRFELRYLPHSPALNALLAGEIDLALGFSVPDEVKHHDLEEITWCEDHYVVISHPDRSTLSLADYLQARHVVVTPWNEVQGILDVQLQQLGYTRQVAIKTPSMLSAPTIIAESDLLMAMPRLAAERACLSTKVKIFELPFDVPPFQVNIYSHKRSGKKAAVHWLKTRLQALAGRH